MLKFRKTKWMAGLLALALTGGLAVTTTACGNEGRESVRDEEDRKESDKKPEVSDEKPETGADKPEEAGGRQESAENPSENDEQDYSALAARIDEGAVAYLEAMKTGDIETILSMTDPESFLYKKLSGIKDYEVGREFIRTLYSGLVYEWQGESDTEDYVERVMGGEQVWNGFSLNLYLGVPDTVGFRLYLTVPGVVFQDGELIPDGYEVTSDEEAMEIVRSVAKLLPVESTPFTVELQEDGGFYFEMVGPFSCMNDSDFESGENFLTKFLSEQISDGVIVGKSDGLFKGYQEEWAQMYSLLKQKDFDGLIAMANGEPDKYIKKTFSEQKPYRTPEELTEEQRAFYDSYVEQIQIYVSEVTYAKMQQCHFTVSIVAPALDPYDREEMAWYTENGIKECTIEYDLGSDREENLIEVMKALLSPIEDAIEYAEKIN